MQPLRTRIPPRQLATLGLNAKSWRDSPGVGSRLLELWSEGDFDEAYETSTTADIARAAGVSKGTFYFHFASKQDLLLEMSSATVQAMIDEVDKGVRQGIPLQSLTPQVMSSMARRVARDRRLPLRRAAALAFGSQLGHATPGGPVSVSRSRRSSAMERTVAS